MHWRTYALLLCGAALASALILLSEPAEAHPVGGTTYTCHFGPPLGQGCPSGNTLAAGSTVNFENPDANAHYLRVTSAGGGTVLNACIPAGGVSTTVTAPWTPHMSTNGALAADS